MQDSTRNTNDDQKDVDIHNLNTKLKTLKIKVNKYKEDIIYSKKQLSEYKNEIKEKSFTMKKLKHERDELNKISHGNKNVLYEIYQSILKTLLKKDLPLISEINLYNKLNAFKERYIASKKAEEIHEKIQNEFENSRPLFINFKNQIQKVQELQNKINSCQDSITKVIEDINLLKQKKYTKRTGMKRIQLNKNNFSDNKNIEQKYLEDNNEKIDYIETTNEFNLQKSKQSTMRLSLKDLSILIENGNFKKKENK